MRLAVVLVPAACLPPHGGRPRGRPARGSGRGLGGARDPPGPRARNGGRVVTALKLRFRDQVGQGFSGGMSLIRDAIDLRYKFPLTYELNCKIYGVTSNVTGATSYGRIYVLRGVRSHTTTTFL